LKASWHPRVPVFIVLGDHIKLRGLIGHKLGVYDPCGATGNNGSGKQLSIVKFIPPPENVTSLLHIEWNTTILLKSIDEDIVLIAAISFSQLPDTPP
jgi:hypothetical protein